MGGLRLKPKRRRKCFQKYWKHLKLKRLRTIAALKSFEREDAPNIIRLSDGRILMVGADFTKFGKPSVVGLAGEKFVFDPTSGEWRVS